MKPRLHFLILAALLPVTLLGAAPATAQTAAEHAAAIESGLERAVQVVGRPVERATIPARMAVLGVPAVSVAVVHGGRIEWARAWGLADVAEERAATTETLFQAASMSKPLAALAALTLVEEGRLTLDGDVNDVLREWRVPDNAFTATHPVTLRTLLSHTAGTTVHGFPGYAPGVPVPTTVQVLDGLPPANTRSVRVDTVPGTLWRYSGGGTTIVQQLLTELTGESYPELLRKRVLEPLGMTQTTSVQPLPDSLRARAATGYRDGGAAVTGRYHTYPEMAAAGLWTTPSDYGRYALGVQRAFRGEPDAILSRSAAELMLTPVMNGYGLGVGVSGSGEFLRFSHGGANEGFRSNFVAFPARGEGIVIMTNSDNGAPLAQEILLAAARVYGWAGLEPHRVTPVPVAPAALDAFVGSYAVPGAQVVVSRDGGRLLLSEDGADALELVPTGTDTFMYLGRGVTVRFERGEDGAVTAISAGNLRIPRIDPSP